MTNYGIQIFTINLSVIGLNSGKFWADSKEVLNINLKLAIKPFNYEKRVLMNRTQI